MFTPYFAIVIWLEVLIVVYIYFAYSEVEINGESMYAVITGGLVFKSIWALASLYMGYGWLGLALLYGVAPIAIIVLIALYLKTGKTITVDSNDSDTPSKPSEPTKIALDGMHVNESDELEELPESEEKELAPRATEYIAEVSQERAVQALAGTRNVRIVAGSVVHAVRQNGTTLCGRDASEIVTVNEPVSCKLCGIVAATGKHDKH